ncbi:MAG TPA: holin [Bacillus bacterium]|uniref:Holin n=1 Tax=Siminovitchia fordii TaxID=254759 RepID=A0ABQ4K6P7_9BACI|nr:holin [Siminovitchia fordii]GIN21402.1 hypothetical protein J1TS3_25360 [Siminovitchia fordii]HBZ10540.1 holin [Bacillus sp. (in: firmicutes)]
MEQILIFATILAPIITVFFQLVKKVFNIQERWTPLVSLVLGIGIGAIATLFTDMEIVYRL